MAWDNTGQEEIYAWLSFEGDTAGADATIEAILAYDALYPHWALSGSARRWWGKLARTASSCCTLI